MPKGVMLKIFITTTLLMLSFFVFQIVFQNNFLDSLYKKASVNSTKKSFNFFIENFVEKYNPSIRKTFDASSYSQNTKTPILILNDDIEVLNRDFFDNMSTLMVNTGVGERIYIVIDRSQYPNLYFYHLIQGSWVTVTGLSYGKSNYIEPLNFSINNLLFYNNKAIAMWKKKSDNISISKSHTGYLNTVKLFSNNEDEILIKSKLLYYTLLDVVTEKINLSSYVKKNGEKYYTNIKNAKEYVVLAETVNIV